MIKPKVGSYWTHKKTGRDYKILCVGLWEETLEKCVVYVSKDNNKCWIRPLEIFMDGRFEEVEQMDAVEFTMCALFLDWTMGLAVKDQQVISAMLEIQIIVLVGTYIYDQLFRGGRK